MDGNEIIGAVGVNGGTVDEDELCTIAGIKAVGLEFKVWVRYPIGVCR